MGVRFQLTEGGAHNEVVLHVRLLENDNVLQQNTLGILGVNLIYACYYFWDRPNAFLQSLLDNLSRDRIAITMISMSGPPELSYVDNRLLGVQLVKNDMTKAIMFDRYGHVQEPDDMLYKKNVLIFRGSFRPITYVTTDMLKTSFGLFKKKTKITIKTIPFRSAKLRSITCITRTSSMNVIFLIGWIYSTRWDKM